MQVRDAIPRARIRVEPLLDVSLVLVLSMALRGTLAHQETVPLQLPRSCPAERVVTVSVSADSQLYLDAEPTGWALLPGTLKQFTLESARSRAVIVVDPQLPQETFVRVLEALRSVGITEVAIPSTRPKEPAPRRAAEARRQTPDGR